MSGRRRARAAGPVEGSGPLWPSSPLRPSGPISSAILIDTGPLVAFLNRGDAHHVWARSQMERLSAPLLTCEAVLAEAAHLLRRDTRGPAALVELIARGVIAVPFRLEDEIGPVRELLARYADVPVSLADACLVRMSELIPEARVVTLDAHFRVYRRLGRRVIPVVMP